MSDRYSANILVTDIDRGSGIAIMRSLAKRGYTVFVASARESAVGFHSRYLSKKFIYPSPKDDPIAFVDAIKCYVQDYEIDLIIPVTDETILPLSQARHEFKDLCQIAVAEPEALDIVTDKMKTMQLAESLGIPTPKTHIIATAQEAQDLSATLQYPVVLKPSHSRLYTPDRNIKTLKVTYANNAMQLYETMKKFEDYNNENLTVLLQEYHHGDGVGVELLMFEGQPVCAFQHHRLHEVPITGGASAFRESVALDEVLYQYAVKILCALNWTGLAMVEFKVGKDNTKLMEINGRVWGSIPLAIASGMDFPNRLADIYLDETYTAPNSVNTNYRVGVRARNLSLDVIWLFSVLKGGKKYDYLPTPSRSELLPALFGYLNPFYHTDIPSWDDPMPGILSIPRIVSKITKKLKIVS